MENPMDIQQISRILPHRYPFLLVDRITELEAGQYAVGIKNVTFNEPFFQGHFPGNPVMPGVLIVEALAQVGGVLALLTVAGGAVGDGSRDIYFAAIDGVRFLKPVVPGDQLRMRVEALRTGSRFWKMKGEAFVGEAQVAKAKIMGTIR